MMTNGTLQFRSAVLSSVLVLALHGPSAQEFSPLDMMPVTEIDLSPTLGAPSTVYGLNDIGTIVGVTTLAPPAPPHGYAFLLSDTAGLRKLGERFDSFEIALDVNNYDEVAGYRDSGSFGQAMLWRETDEGGPWTGRSIAVGAAFAINDATSVVGVHWAPTSSPLPVNHAFRWSPAGGLEDVESLTGVVPPWYYFAPLSDARAIRNDGVMGGERGGRAVIWLPTGEPHELAGFVATAINDAALAVGGTSSSANPIHNGPDSGQPLAWRDGVAIPISALPGAAFGVNEAGYAVGRIAVDGIRHGFVWHEALGLRDLGPGAAYAIDETGRIVGARMTGQGPRATLWKLELRVEDLFVGLETVATRLSDPAIRGGLGGKVQRTIAAAREDWAAGRVKRAVVRLQQTIQSVDTLERAFDLAPGRAAAIRGIATELLLRL